MSKKLLDEKNRIDFAHLQTKFYELLNSKTGEMIKEQVKYVMVDEYQDTNYIQELIFFALAKRTKNICVVGDEDQSIYRFRGATVQNLLDFSRTCQRKLGVKPCEIPLIKNFRSHKSIITSYNAFMESYQGWRVGAKSFRYPGKKIEPGLKRHLDYPACFQIEDDEEEVLARKTVSFIKHLLDKKIIDDPSQAAILMKSIKNEHFDSIAWELKKAGIDYYAPRAGKYLASTEVKEIIGAYLLLLDWQREDNYHGNYGRYLDWLEELKSEVKADFKRNYRGIWNQLNEINRQFKQLIRDYDTVVRIFGDNLVVTSENYEEFVLHTRFLSPENRNRIRRFIKRKGKKNANESNIKKLIALDKGLLDYFYILMAQEPFRGYIQGIKGEGKVRNLATFSNIISMFQEYRMHRIISAMSLKNEWLQRSFINNFLYIVYQQEMNEYEDRTAIVPCGSVPIMTIHQAKGLEFPVVIIGRLHVQLKDQKVDRELRDFFRRKNDEPPTEISRFDHMRLFYVAMSRAKNVLCLLNQTESYNRPHDSFEPVLNSIPTMDENDFDVFDTLPAFKVDEPKEFKPSFGFKSDFQYYQTCPTQYKMFRYYSFAPAMSNEMFFGTLVHQTIDDIHNIFLNATSRDAVRVEDTQIEALFRNNYETLKHAGLHPLSLATQDAALNQVKEYFHSSQDLVKNVYKTEVRLLKSKDDYNLTGVVDIIANPNGEYHLYDFKAQKMETIKTGIKFYEDQLNLYYHILKSSYGIDVSRMFIYSTHTENKSDKIHEVQIDPSRVNNLVDELDVIAHKIIDKDFSHNKREIGKATCTKCDLHHFCRS